MVIVLDIMEHFWFYFVGVIIGLSILSAIGISIEKKGFNNGVCPRCGVKLEYFDTDSQGGRGYKCPICWHTAWVSYKRVDRDYRKKGKAN